MLSQRNRRLGIKCIYKKSSAAIKLGVKSKEEDPLRGGLGEQPAKGSPVKPGAHVHTGTWFTT